ncbi:glycoside hydrolase family 38 C-terminal domain-containing protein [Pedobacter arcticus]|uniref:glycoside hydrolase family 38 C-terminal domain-containing protein n=1 Tax=Pedobacter arcticus TaxID=752140 RepID=UPI0012B51732|nr:glycoside hydrolase family 38 C-terminal domain-containing protein [Pedobacter arcticus]
MMKRFLLFVPLIFIFYGNSLYSQTAYFVDGFHGGIWGHYPEKYTSFIITQLDKHPQWNINLEIEPETWDNVAITDKEAYLQLQSLVKNQSKRKRIEFVNPAYGQSYMFNISGESIIRQFSYGIDKIRFHFPEVQFHTYSSEEPCFTSALPGILRSFGFKYASLKNPNTCWGGYTRAFGGELVNWIGPDGTSILTVPRYQIELLKESSTWETIANDNAVDFLQSAFKFGIKSPVGMCLQDAGWRFGPWLRKDFYMPTEYTTWANYFENVADRSKVTDWNFSQEDLQVSLVWGAQILQKLAQNVRIAENKIVQAEKVASIKTLDSKTVYPAVSLDNAWKSLLLAQHHDSWIVPYNVLDGQTWADKVKSWTAFTDTVSDSIIRTKTDEIKFDNKVLKIYNTTLSAREEWVSVAIPHGWNPHRTSIADENHKLLDAQVVGSDKTQIKLLFKAKVKPFGYNKFYFKKGIRTKFSGAEVKKLADGDFVMETNLYKLVIDSKRGGIIKNLIAKNMNNKDFVDNLSDRGFNELRGYFYNKGGYHSSGDKSVEIAIVENGPARISLSITGEIAGEKFQQLITMDQGQERIDFKLNIDWKSNQGIGAYKENNYQDAEHKKAFYNDKYKLLTLFPLNLKGQKVFKNAPFDVTESKLKNTFFSSWDSIKNNIILNWVDVVDEKGEYGCALYTDHTTSYTHGENFPLGLNVQYSGKGLWGMDYTIKEATEICYSLIPHKGDWKVAELWQKNELINEPLLAVNSGENRLMSPNPLLTTDQKGWVLSSSVFDGNDLLVRIFNASGKDTAGDLKLGFNASKAQTEELNGVLIQSLMIGKANNSIANLKMSIPSFAFKTIRFFDVNKSERKRGGLD